MSEYRSFRLLRESYAPPERTSVDYNESEKQIFREQFKPIAQRYRFCSRAFIMIFLALFLPMFFGWMNGTSFGKWFPFLVFVLIALAITLFIVFRPKCPACKGSVESEIRIFCPECGGKVRPGGFFKSPHCLSCGTNCLLWERGICAASTSKPNEVTSFIRRPVRPCGEAA